MQQHLSRARTLNIVGKIFFFCVVLFSVYEFAVAVTYFGKEGMEEIVNQGFVFGGASLVFGLFGAFAFHQIEAVFLHFAEEEAKKAMAEFPGEDGLSGDFCREIFSYSPAQLRLILDEQEDEYTPEEFAYIRKVLKRKTENEKK